MHPVGQVASEPLKRDTTDSIMLQFVEEYFMVNSVKMLWRGRGKLRGYEEGTRVCRLSAYDEIQIACGKRVKIYHRVLFLS